MELNRNKISHLKIHEFWPKWWANTLPLFSKRSIFPHFIEWSAITYFDYTGFIDILWIWKEIKTDPFENSWLLAKMMGLPLPFLSKKGHFSTFHRMICKNIFWIDRGHRRFLGMKRYEKQTLLKIHEFWTKWGADPLPFFFKKGNFSTFHEIICSNIFLVDRGHRHLLKMKWNKNRPFWKFIDCGQNDGEPLAIFIKKGHFSQFMKWFAITYFE